VVVTVEVERGQAIIAREEELRLPCRLDEGERLLIVAPRQLRVAMALLDLAQHYERHRQVVELAELAVEVEGRLRRREAPLLAPVCERAVGNRQVRVQP
jgi:hypothetical protein